jgi:hypothetical protein
MPCGGMYDFGGTDGGQVAVSLVRENHLIRMDALDAGCNRRRSSVSGLLHIAIKIQIVIVCAAYRRYSDGGTFYVQFVYNLGYQSMNDSVGTAGAVVHGYIHQCMGSVKYYSHG